MKPEFSGINSAQNPNKKCHPYWDGIFDGNGNISI
jgi:hypothetical protein